MTLTFEEENILKKQIEVQKLEQQLRNRDPTEPKLSITKDVEISTLKQQIKNEEVHTTRAEYIKKVQPMKDNYRALIVQNKQIEIDNKVAIDTARSTDELERHVILDDINTVNSELNILLNEIKIYESSTSLNLII